MKQTTIGVGDKVIYQPAGSCSGVSRPVVTSVTSLTATGWPLIAEAKAAFRPHRWSEEWNGKDGSLYLFTKKRLTELTEAADASEQYLKEQREERERVARERSNRLVRELSEVRQACNDTLPIRKRETLSDGARLIMLDVPLHPERLDKKYDLLIVRVVDQEGYNDAYTEKVMLPVAESTYISNRHGFTTGFSSRSSLRATNGDTEDDLLWELVRDRYFD